LLQERLHRRKGRPAHALAAPREALRQVRLSVTSIITMPATAQQWAPRPARWPAVCEAGGSMQHRHRTRRRVSRLK